MESGAADVGRLAPRPPRRLIVDRRLMGIAIVTEITVVFLAYMVVNVPVEGPKLTPDEAPDHWHAALIGALVVALVSAFVIARTLRARRLTPEGPADAGAETDRPRIPRALRFEHVPGQRIAIAAALSLATVPLSVALGVPSGPAYVAFLAPWIPLVVTEARYKKTRDAIFAAFGLLVLLQMLHMVEHSTQVGQLLFTDGDLSKSHGLIGQFDFELVHFVTDTTLWMILGALTIIFRGRNLWLWVAFAAASLHEIEHLYLIWINLTDKAFYLAGGFAGIMGTNGLIGSPLDRPYLHYTYNFIVFVPMLIAVWDEARRVDRLHARASS